MFISAHEYKFSVFRRGIPATSRSTWSMKICSHPQAEESPPLTVALMSCVTQRAQVFVRGSSARAAVSSSIARSLQSDSDSVELESATLGLRHARTTRVNGVFQNGFIPASAAFCSISANLR